MDVTKPTATGKLCVPKLLVIDDEPEICALITETFSGEFEVASASDGTSGIRAAIQNRPDLVLVDLRMPGMDGIEVCKVLRENFSALETSPLLMVMTGRDDAEVASFQSGADDFVAKPFGLEQLRARIHARLRARLRSRLSTRQVHGNLEIDSERLEARIHGELIELSSLEFRLLHYFMQTNGKVVSRSEVLEANWPGVVVTDRTVDTHVSKLRKAISGSQYQIHTVYGAGYCWRPSEN